MAPVEILVFSRCTHLGRCHFAGVASPLKIHSSWTAGRIYDVLTTEELLVCNHFELLETRTNFLFCSLITDDQWLAEIYIQNSLAPFYYIWCAKYCNVQNEFVILHIHGKKPAYITLHVCRSKSCFATQKPLGQLSAPQWASGTAPIWPNRASALEALEARIRHFKMMTRAIWLYMVDEVAIIHIVYCFRFV